MLGWLARALAPMGHSMTYLQSALPQIRLAIVMALGVFVACTMLFSLFETRAARRGLLALTVSSCAVAAWYVLAHPRG